ncbi:MAG: hypothetical protein L0271_06165 [Gemmatimonadetes bacterium]|nr:hypothetical protein [Gemmatimonadota bacterium]
MLAWLPRPHVCSNPERAPARDAAHRHEETTLSADAALIIGTLWLCAGFGLLVLLPARIALALRAVGIALGACVGSLAGSFAFNAPAAIIAGALAGAALGLWLATVRRLLFVQFAAALIATFLAVLGGLAFMERAPFLPLILIAVGAGALLAQLREDDAAVAAVSFMGAQAIFNSAFVPIDAWAIWPEQIAEQVTQAYLGALRPFVATSLLFVGWAIVARRWSGQGPHAHAGTVLHRAGVGLAAVIVITTGVTGALWLAGETPITRFELIGVHELAWPIAAGTSSAFLLLLQRTTAPAAPDAASTSRQSAARLVARHFVLALFGVTILPVSTGALFAAFGTGWAPLHGFYAGFVHAPPPILFGKWLFSIAILPALLANLREAH